MIPLIGSPNNYRGLDDDGGGETNSSTTTPREDDDPRSAAASGQIAPQDGSPPSAIRGGGQPHQQHHHHRHHSSRHHHHHDHERPRDSMIDDEGDGDRGEGGRSRAAFCANFRWRSLVFRSLGKERIFQLLYFLMGPIMLCLTLAIGSHNPDSFKMVATIGVTMLMVVWWLFEVLPMGVTSFIPVVLFPIMGIVSGNQICSVYLSDQVLILFGSCMLATAVEEYKLHRRLALAILRRTGESPYRLVLGFLFVTSFLSMWLSNTATAAMMAPLATAVMEHLAGVEEEEEDDEDDDEEDEEEQRRGRRSAGSRQGGGRRRTPSSSSTMASKQQQEEEEERRRAGRGGGGGRRSKQPPPALGPPSSSSSPAPPPSLTNNSSGQQQPPSTLPSSGNEEGGGSPQRSQTEMVEIKFWDHHQQQEGGEPQPHHDDDDDEEEEDEEVARIGAAAAARGGGGGRGQADSLDSCLSSVPPPPEYWCGIRIDCIKFSISVAICYGASLGGMSTLTGTGTNLVLNGVLMSNFANAVPISFGTFFCIAGPIAFFCVLCLWVYLCWKMRMASSAPPATTRDYLKLACRNLLPNGYEPPSTLLLAPRPDPSSSSTHRRANSHDSSGGGGALDTSGASSHAVNDFDREYNRLPPLGFEEKVIIVDFFVIATLWFFRDPKGIRGWTHYLPAPSYVTDGTVAMMGALALFIIPRRDFFTVSTPPPPPIAAAQARHPRAHLAENRVRTETAANHINRGGGGGGGASTPTPRQQQQGGGVGVGTEAFGVLPWDLVLRRMPWNVLFLVGGGLALSLAYKESNLSHVIATAFVGLETVPFPVVEASVCIVTILISNFISNVATANIILPPLGCIAVQLGRHPMALMLPATLAGSFSFISPIGTPANAIAYSMGHLTVRDLASVGSILTALCVVMLSILFPPLFKAFVDGLHVPDWAKNSC